MPELTQMLEQLESGETELTDKLLPIVYEELRMMAGRELAKEKPGQTLQTTALVHEAYLRLVGNDQPWEGRAHFFGAAAEAMRRILVESARRKSRQKRGGERTRQELHESAVGVGDFTDEVLMVDELFDRLMDMYPIEAELAKLKYFGGFNTSEAALALGIPSSTAHRYWSFAKAWLYRELKKSDE